MKRLFLFVFAMIISACTNDGGSKGMADPPPPSPEVTAAMNKYATELVNDDFNKFLLSVRNYIDELREGYRSSFPKDLEKFVSSFEQRVSALEANSAPTAEQIRALQDEGGSAISTIYSTGGLDREGLMGRYRDNLTRIYGLLSQNCAGGRYGDNAVTEKNGWVPERVKTSFIKICQSKLESVRPVSEKFPEKLTVQEMNQVNDVEEKWQFFEEKKTFTDEDLTRLIGHARMLPLNLTAGIDKQYQVYTNRIYASRNILGKLTDEYYRRHR
jgi:hypothetical protein